ncbi:type I polyketide synthase [Dactylosporangium sp. NPDC000244]|uniref:type I polyketide synthase n=1 Tax=Dactylosporangium sp. NPDC000244 TaxID=3154365 RepID=UPI0033181431
MTIRDPDGPIAVVGIAARFPGASTVDEFWDAIVAGREAIRDLGDDELLGGGVDPRWLADPDYVRTTASIEDVDRFDAAFFDISGREAAAMDPQHRIFLETCWHALEDAGLRTSAGAGSPVGVFAGSGGVLTSYLPEVLAAAGTPADPTASLEQLGSDKDFLATRVSYKLNLTGPSLTVQTACSTSLVAVHLACQSLLRGECEAALAGGVNIRLPVAAGYWYRRGGILSPDGRCRPFDVGAQGTIFGSGVGAVVLKPLAAARRDGDRVYATVLGTGINNDGGGKASYGAASRPGQLVAMRRALAAAGVDPATIGYVEAHGTGVPLGDPAEIGALKQLFGREEPCAIGSVKALIGHMEAASGIAGLIKAALALHHGQIPPSPYFTAPSPRLRLDGSGLFVNPEPLPMPGTPGRAAVNSLGIGGTNAFAVLEQGPPCALAEPRPGPELITVSARSEEALRTLAGRWAQRLREPGAALRDLAYTSHVGRTGLRHRLSVLADTAPAAAERINAWLAGGGGSADAGVTAPARPRVGFLFPGQSAEYAGMAVGLYRAHPAFRAAVDRHAEQFRRITGVDPLDVFADPAAQTRAELLQPAIFLLQVALAELWASLGVRPDAVVGHSLGEYAAACVAGVFDPAEGLELVGARGRAFAAVPGAGRMTAVGCTDVAELERLVAAHGDAAAVAAYNAPQRVTVSGTDAAMRELVGAFERRGWMTIPLDTTHAFHSAAVAPVVAPLVAAAGRIAHRPPAVPLALNLTGARAGADELDAHYWGRQLTAPVRFADGVGDLLAVGCTVLLEVGPGRTLSTAGRAQSDGDVLWLPGLSARIPDADTVLAHLARLARAGLAVDWAAYYAPFRPAKASAPRYPFARTRHWIAPGSAAPPAQEPPELRRLPLPQSPQRRYETTVSARSPRPLADHEISGRLVVPGAYHTACLIEAAGAGADAVVEDLVFPRALVVGEAESRVQLVLTPDGERGLVAQALGLARAEDPFADGSWQVQAEGRIRPVDAPPASWTAPPANHGGRAVAPDELYALFEAAGFRFGPAFRWITRLRLDGEDTTGSVDLAARSPREHTMALLDACVQVAIAARVARSAPTDGVLLPFRIHRAVLHAPRGAARTGLVHVRQQAAEAARALADVSLTDEQGNPLLDLVGLELRAVRLGAAAPDGPARPGAEPQIYAEAWEPAPAPGPATAGGAAWIVLADRRGLWRPAVAALEAAGHRCTVAEAGAGFARRDDGRYELDPADAGDLARLLHETAPTGVLSCLGLDGPEGQNGPGSQNSYDGRDVRAACGFVPALVQAAERAGRTPNAVVLLTRGAVAVHDAAEVDDPHGAMLWGLGRSAALESPQLGVRLLDLDPRDPAGSVRRLPDALGAEAAIRDGRIYRCVLRPASVPAAPAVRAGGDGCYLITGGTGALGRRTAAWLAGRGVRRVVLASRRADDSAGAFEHPGLEVIRAGLDVTDRAAVDALVGRAQREWGGLRGIVHAAGVLDDAVLSQLSWDRFAAVLGPKVAGAWNLHRATEGIELEHFILYSSTAALLGAPGQAHYAAGNAFLDGLAHHRRGRGLPALSVGWGPWSAGMAAGLSPRLRARIRDAGFAPLEPDPALAALDRLMAGPGGRYGVFCVDWSRYRARHRGGPAVDADEQPGAVAPDGSEPLRRLRSDWPGAAAGARRGLVLRYVRVMLAARLARPVADIGEDLQLQAAGLDSLVAVEVRGQIFRDLDVDLPLTGLLEGKALGALVDELLDRLAREAPAAAAPAAASTGASTGAPSRPEAEPFSPQEAERLLASLDTLTPDQLDALLPWLAEQGTAGSTEG